jgi:hypothetical protein
MSNLLLEWMSFRSTGRLNELPPELSHGPPRRMLDDLSMLGHIEMPSASSWRIAPPVLAGLCQDENQEPAAVLCGARTPAVIERVANASRTIGAQMSETPVRNRPSHIRIAAPSMVLLADVAALAGVPLQNNAAYTLLACLPAIRDWPRRPCQMVAGRVETVRRFSGSKSAWVDSSLAEATAARRGFFRIKRDWDWVSILKSSQSDCAYIDDRAGRMFTALKLHLASWDSVSRSFGLPVELFPPTAIARALTLCTGSLPQFDRAGRRISFGGVSPCMQRLALAITGLRLA